MAKTNTTQSGVSNTDNTAPQLDLFETNDDTAAAFLDRWTDDQDKKPAPETEVETPDPKEPEEEPEDKETEEPTEDGDDSADPEDTDGEDADGDDTEDDDNEDGEDSEEEDGDKPEAKTLDDDAVVEIKVDDKNLKVSVKELKRLYGQEAALTKKSQQVAAKRKEIEAEATKVSAVMERMYQKAQAKWEPYSKVDMLVAAKTLEADEFTALRAAANEAYEEFKFITEEVEAHIKDTQTKQQENLKTAAAEAVKVLKEKIPGWNQEVYGKILSYGVSQGLPEEAVNQLVDPAAILLINKARLYDEGQKVVTKKKVKTAKKVMKPASNPSEKFASDTQVKAAQKFQQTRSVDDAADLFLSRWQD